MQDKDDNRAKLFASLVTENYCYLTTMGRVSRKPHEIEIWFGRQGNSLYLLSGGGDDSDWVKNLRADPNVTVRIGKHTFAGTARIVNDSHVESLARPMLAAKYQRWQEGRSMSDWARSALIVGIDLNL
jgi:deazaflavin-dependent oxidoreductase (nitroreductase family)